MKKITCLFFALSLTQFSFSQSIATYDITFNSVWNSVDHGTLPNNPHWSNLVGATHNNQVTFFEIDEMATIGIKDVAEKGNNTQILSEVNTAISNSYSDQWLQQGFSAGALGSATLSDIEVSEDFPLLSLVSMIAPSPDWFIGINSFSLLDESDNWKTFVEIDMYAYDAGTDSGVNYESGDIITTPQENITSLQGVSPFNNNKIGTLTITLKSVLSVEKPNPLVNLKIYPNPTKGNITVYNTQNIELSKIEVYNVLGSKLKEIHVKNGLSKIDVDLTKFKKGMYLVSIKSINGNINTQKLIIR